MSVCCTDARALPLADGSVQGVVTSPPYWGLRDYGVAGQLGLEATPEAYVAGLVAVMRQVWRVLREDGVLWLNLGDSYAAQGGAQVDGTKQVHGSQRGAWGGTSRRAPGGLKPKDLVGIPWRVAFALQADGWYLRADIIWSKPNPMPESVTDRPTKSHEYVFLLTKAERYYWNADAVREAFAFSTLSSNGIGVDGRGYASNQTITPRDRHAGGEIGWGNQAPGALRSLNLAGRNVRSVWTIATQPYAGAHFATMPEALARRCILAASRPGDLVLDPFVGSGTVCRVALALGRRAVGCNLSRPYLALAQERLRVTRGLPLDLEPEPEAVTDPWPDETQGLLF